jgi:formamidopyrimidine-DNA glycosylase
MPELPDVEGFKRILAKNALRKRIVKVTVNDARILGKLSARAFAARLQGARLVEAGVTASTSWRNLITAVGSPCISA